MAILSSSPGHRSFTGNASPVPPEAPQADADLFEICEHTFVRGYITFSKRNVLSTRTLTRVLIVPVSRQLSRMHGTSEEGRRTMLALHLGRTLQMRRLRSSDL